MKKLFISTWMLFIVMSMSFAQQKTTVTKSPATQQKTTTPTVTVASLSKEIRKQQMEIDTLKQICRLQQIEINRLKSNTNNIREEYEDNSQSIEKLKSDIKNLNDQISKIYDDNSGYNTSARPNSLAKTQEQIKELWETVDRIKYKLELY